MFLWMRFTTGKKKEVKTWNRENGSSLDTNCFQSRMVLDNHRCRVYKYIKYQSFHLASPNLFFGKQMHLT